MFLISMDMSSTTVFMNSKYAQLNEHLFFIDMQNLLIRFTFITFPSKNCFFENSTVTILCIKDKNPKCVVLSSDTSACN